MLVVVDIIQTQIFLNLKIVLYLYLTVNQVIITYCFIFKIISKSLKKKYRDRSVTHVNGQVEFWQISATVVASG